MCWCIMVGAGQGVAGGSADIAGTCVIEASASVSLRLIASPQLERGTFRHTLAAAGSTPPYWPLTPALVVVYVLHVLCTGDEASRR